MHPNGTHEHSMGSKVIMCKLEVEVHWRAVPPLALGREPSPRVGITPRELSEGPQSFRVDHDEVRLLVLAALIHEQHRSGGTARWASTNPLPATRPCVIDYVFAHVFICLLEGFQGSLCHTWLSLEKLLSCQICAVNVCIAEKFGCMGRRRATRNLVVCPVAWPAQALGRALRQVRARRRF